MRRSVMAMLLASLVVPCAPAGAASVQVNERRGVVVYRAAPGERNDLRITASDGVFVADAVPIHAGPGCESADRYLVRCDQTSDALIRLGNRDDRAKVTLLRAPDTTIDRFELVTIEGGRGDDVLTGGPERDNLLGGRGTDELRGGAGIDRVLAGGYGVSTDRTADRLRGGRDSDLLIGSAGPNVMEPGPGVDQVYAGRGRDIVLTRDGAIEQIHCGAGEDSAVTDGFDFPLACEHHEPYSSASPIPLEFYAAGGAQTASFSLGCREEHPAECVGTAQLEIGDRPLTEEQPFTYANRHRLVILMDTLEPMPLDWATRPDLAIRIRASDAAGAPTDDRYPVQSMLVGDPFVG
jgi:RTX calcium-binding nonapeptide repeat (4 copies)